MKKHTVCYACVSVLCLQCGVVWHSRGVSTVKFVPLYHTVYAAVDQQMFPKEKKKLDSVIKYLIWSWLFQTSLIVCVCDITHSRWRKKKERQKSWTTEETTGVIVSYSTENLGLETFGQSESQPLREKSPAAAAAVRFIDWDGLWQLLTQKNIVRVTPE